MRHVAGKGVNGSMVTVLVNDKEVSACNVEYSAVDSACTCRLRLLKTRWEELLDTLPDGFGGECFQIKVTTSDPDPNPLTTLGSQTDLLDDCRITGIAGAHAGGEDELSTVVVTLSPRQIRWSGKSLFSRGAP